MELVRVGGHQEIGAGYSNAYTAIGWDEYGNTVNDVLRAVREWSQTQNHQEYLGDGFGNKAARIEAEWGIYISAPYNNWFKKRVVKTSWGDMGDGPWKWPEYTGDGTETVTGVTGSGGWYAGINITITVDKFNDQE